MIVEGFLIVGVDESMTSIIYEKIILWKMNKKDQESRDSDSTLKDSQKDLKQPLWGIQLGENKK